MRYALALAIALCIAMPAVSDDYNIDRCMSPNQRGVLQKEIKDMMEQSKEIESCYIMESRGEATFVIVMHKMGIAVVYGIMGFDEVEGSMPMALMQITNDQAREVIQEHEKSLKKKGGAL